MNITPIEGGFIVFTVGIIFLSVMVTITEFWDKRCKKTGGVNNGR